MRTRSSYTVLFALFALAVGTVAAEGLRPASVPESAVMLPGNGLDLSITNVDNPDPVTAGNNITYTITASNIPVQGMTAPSTVSSVYSVDTTIPVNTTFVSLASAAGWSCTVPAVGGTGAVSCGNAAFPTGTSAAFTLVVKVAPATPAFTFISSTATVAAPSGINDFNPNNNSATATTQVIASADLSISKTGPATIVAGQNLAYTITLTNSGPSNSVSPTWTDTLPANTTFVSLSAVGGWTPSTPSVGSGGTVTVSATTMAPSPPSVVFTLTVNVSAIAAPSSIISNTATFASNEAIPGRPTGPHTPDPTPINNSSTLAVTVLAAVPTMATWLLLALGLTGVALGTRMVSRRRKSRAA